MAKIETLTKEQLLKAAACKTTDELMKVAKTEGVELTKDEAEAYLAELADVELDDELLKKAAGGVCWTNCPKEAECPGHACGTVGWENFKGC
jgi:ribosomal protein L12E/L44/L45/RPP1/RPP2